MGSESSQEDSKHYEKAKFNMNILVCGNYNEKKMETDLTNIQITKQHEGNKYLKKGTHNTIPEWTYYFFEKKNIGENTYDFIHNSIIIRRESNNLLIFYTGLNDFTAENLLQFYNKQLRNYHPFILIIKKKDENINLSGFENLNKNFIKICEENLIDILINMIEISSYFNQLGDEIGFPKKFTDMTLLEKDNCLITKYFFTINILLCGPPGVGKSALINSILGKEKSFSKIGKHSITNKIIKYIHEKFPIILYDSPGLENDKDIESVQKLIREKNEALNEEKNRIHCIFFVINRKTERTPKKKEYELIEYLIKQKMDIFIIITHAESKDNYNSKEYKESIIIDLNNYCELIKNLKDSIYPVELKNENNYKKFGVKELFNDIFKKYEDRKINEKITEKNIKNIKSEFIINFLSKEEIKNKLRALSYRVKANFKLLAATLGRNPNAKGSTMLTVSVIKIISNIYNHQIATKDCIKIIKDLGYTDETKNEDTFVRKFEKYCAIPYFNGPASKEVDYVAKHLIEKYSKEINNDEIYYKFLNDLREAINKAIDSLKEVNDE